MNPTFQHGAILRRIRAVCGAIPGVAAAYSEADSIPEYRLPTQLTFAGNGPVIVVEIDQEMPAVNYWPHNRMIDWAYTVNVNVYCYPVGIGDDGLPDVFEWPGRVVQAMADEITLGGLATSCFNTGALGPGDLTYAGVEFRGWQVSFEVRESISNTSAVGAEVPA